MKHVRGKHSPKQGNQIHLSGGSDDTGLRVNKNKLVKTSEVNWFFFKTTLFVLMNQACQVVIVTERSKVSQGGHYNIGFLGLHH